METSFSMITPIVLGLWLISVAESTSPIIYKRVEPYICIYDDRGTKADYDVSIWRPATLEHGYFALGDVAVASHEEPQTESLLVKASSGNDDALASPTSFTEIWNDKGSGGSYNVRIMRMNPPTGYVCLGDVVVVGYGNIPDGSLYRCVKSQYASRSGTYQLIWLDSGSGASSGVGIWGNRVSQLNLQGLDANTFTSFGTHSTPGDSPLMLDSRYSQNSQDFAISSQKENTALTVYEVPDLTQIWNDGRSGARNDVAVWRSNGPSETFSLGDIAVPGGRPDRGYVVKAQKSDALDRPIGFRQIWNDAGSGATWDVAFYEPQCSPGYRALGHVSIRSNNEKPDSELVRCVKAEYTVQGGWEWVWNDVGSSADKDVSVWTAVSSVASGQGVGAMSTVGRHGDMYTLAFVLDHTVTNYIVGGPVEQYILQNVVYNFDDRQIENSETQSISRTIVENRGSTLQVVIRAMSYSYEEVYSWGNSVGLEVGVSMSIEAGIPLIGEVEVTVSAAASYSYETGGSTTITKTDTISVYASVQPYSQKSAVIVGKRYTVRVPYTATLITKYPDGSQNTLQKFSGVYEGVQVNEIRVIYEADIPLSMSSEVLPVSRRNRV